MSDISKIKFAWKVVKVESDTLYSAVKSGAEAINYSRKGWIRPQKYANQFLFVFRTREHARAFRDNRSWPAGYKIIKVEVKNPSETAVDTSNITFYADRYPAGTIFVSAVKVVPAPRYAYKVTYKSDFDGFVSALHDRPRAVNYALGKTTTPKRDQNPFLFVFDNLDAAKDFRRGRSFTSRYQIFRCLITNPRERARGVDGYWFVAGDGNWPEGTLFCDSVKPIEKVA